MLRSLRAVFAVQSVSPTVVADIMSKVCALSCPRKGLPGATSCLLSIKAAC